MYLNSRRMNDLGRLIDAVAADLSAPDALEAVPSFADALQRVETLSTLLADVGRAVREALPAADASAIQFRAAWLAQLALTPLAHAAEHASWVCKNTSYLAGFELSPAERQAAEEEAVGLQYETVDQLQEAVGCLRSAARELAAVPTPHLPGPASSSAASHPAEQLPSPGSHRGLT